MESLINSLSHTGNTVAEVKGDRQEQEDVPPGIIENLLYPYGSVMVAIFSLCWNAVVSELHFTTITYGCLHTVQY